jgi:hypothetical protein
MRRILICLVVPALAATALPAAAQTGHQTRVRDDSATEQQARAQRADERRICVTERLSESRMPRRICRTQAEWDALQGGDDD